ncbi:MAG TPA: flippase activity-associated protein Agl23 [Opitutaceae bacterium]|nr:flippase activity-associated protein Agl23 [Opitutaceae bacterium]
MPKNLPRWLPLALLTLAAFWWRARDLASRPMHADEANQAVKAGELLESGRYAFDPLEHHGPVLYYAVLPVAWCRGQHALASLDEVTVRLVPALAGAASVFLLGLLAAPLGRWPSLAAAAFLAVSPPAVYYSRFFIQETLLGAFALAAFVCARQWWSTGRARWAAAAGACLGLMQATKASAPVFALAALAAALATRRRGGPPVARGLAGAGLAGAAAAVAVAALFYSSFGAHPAGIRDALATYGDMAARLRAGDTGHEKPWGYFLRLFAWQRAGGLVFEQAGFAALALAGLGVALAGGDPLLRWAAAYSGLVLLALSATPYKTPWHAIHLVPGLSLLAAGALAALSRTGPGRLAAAAAALGVLGLLAFQADRVSRAYASDARNPYAYVHSSPDVLKFRAMADAALSRSPAGPVRVISEEYWPLPWYFRGLGPVGYWTRPPADCDGAMVVASAGLADQVRARLHGAYAESYLGLRPGFVCVVFTPRP